MTTAFEMALNTITVVAVIASYGSGVWGIYGHFLDRTRPERAMQVTSLLSLAGLLWFLYDRWHKPVLGGVADIVIDLFVLGLLAVSMSVFWWAIATTRQQRLTLAFSKDQPAFIHMAGPYAWVRHPFYTSYILFWIATATGAVSPWFWLMPVMMGIIYWRAIQGEEAKFAASPISAQYEVYKSQTGMLYPIRMSRRNSGAHT